MKKLSSSYNQYGQHNRRVITNNGVQSGGVMEEPEVVAEATSVIQSGLAGSDISPRGVSTPGCFYHISSQSAPPQVSLPSPSPTSPPTPLMAMNRPLSQSLDYIVVTSWSLVGCRMKDSEIFSFCWHCQTQPWDHGTLPPCLGLTGTTQFLLLPSYPPQ